MGMVGTSPTSATSASAGLFEVGGSPRLEPSERDRRSGRQEETSRGGRGGRGTPSRNKEAGDGGSEDEDGGGEG